MRTEGQSFVRTSISVPLAEQLRQWSAKPFRWVQLPHGTPVSGIGVDRHTSVFQTGIEGALPSCPSITFRGSDVFVVAEKAEHGVFPAAVNRVDEPFAFAA